MMKKNGMMILSVAALMMLAGTAMANEAEPVHRAANDSPAVGDEGKIMLYGVILEKDHESLRINDPHDTRQQLQQSDTSAEDQ